jgi:signal transduction histidine kinase
MKIFSKRLQGKIFFITSLTICVLVGIFIIIEFNRDKKILYDRQLMHMKEASHAVRNSIESVRIPLLVQSILDEYTQNILNLEDTRNSDRHDPSEKPSHQLHVVNTDAIIMASTRSEYIGLPLEEAIRHKEEGLNEVLQGIIPYSIEQMEHAGVEVIDVSVPIRENGTIIGALHYVEPYMKLERLIKESFIRHVLFALILIVSLCIIINFFLTKMVTNPIQVLSTAMDGIRLKRHSRKVEISTGDEIGILANSFNEMSQALKQREQEVREYTTKLEEMVKARTKELEESHSHLLQTEKITSMGRLAGSVAHEINNPIGIIVSRAECMLMDAKEHRYSGLLIKDLEVLIKHANRIASITKGILMFSRKSPAEFSLLDIDNLIDETLLLLGKELSTGNIDVQKQTDCDLPQIYGNGSQLQQVFLNLIINARDAMPDCGTIKINSHCDSRGMLHVSVSDTGCGINEEYQDKIFDPFFSTKKEGVHTGLGLSITYGIIKDHSGEISVESDVGKGTSFHIMLPQEKVILSEVHKNEQ